MKKTAFFLIMLLQLTTGAFAAPPEYTSMKAGCRMSMDGILDEPAWQKARPVGPFHFPWFKSGEQEQTEAKIVWDDERIYFAFTCDDKYIWADHYSFDSSVYADDCCEAFISPVPEGPERMDYINYEINCIGSSAVGYHAGSRNANKGRWYPGGLEIGRYIKGTVNKDDDTDEGWVLEFSVPWSHFREFGAKFPPRKGQVIYLNLNRLGGKTNVQNSQWSPNPVETPSFHSPQYFGKVIFSTASIR
jgi:hypothetical protein